MHLVIINGSPRSNTKSNTGIIINSFLTGYQCNGNTYELYNIANKNQWAKAKEAFYENSHILIAFPLYVESLPGLLINFLESLLPVPKDNKIRKMSFILQSGFLEGCQRRCCEELLEKIPEKLGCQFAGTLSRGDMFAAYLYDSEMVNKLVQPFQDMGRYFAENQHFFGKEAEEFTGKEYISERESKVINRMIKFALNEFAENLGCSGSLYDKPYAKETE